MTKSDTQSILIIYTGGTIGMREDPMTKTLSPMRFELIQDEIPELHKLGFKIDSVTFSPPIDSANMTPEIWIDLAKTIKECYSKYDGFVILHGTDTMAYTASALSYMLENLDKPVILTGSQLPIGVLRTDGKENIITAIQIAAAQRKGKAIVPEVCVYFSSFLFRGNRTTKEDSQQFSAFASHHYPKLAIAGIDIEYYYGLINYPSSKGTFKINTSINDNVIVLKIFPGLNRKYFESILSLPGIKGIILESYVSQCPGGRVKMGYYETSRELQEAGVVSGKDITIEAAVTKLMFLLGQKLSSDEVVEYLNQNLSGEIEN
ncbi:MAG: asparaginase [Bacteroidia bacterium]|nr:asparaginase [Bacteroidia bacterium]